MPSDMSRQPGRRLVAIAAIVAVPLALLAFLAGWAWRGGAPSHADRAAIGLVVRDYILEHPEILPQAMENLQRRENAGRVRGMRGDIERPFPGAVLGNPRGAVTLVEFTDFACGYCRQSVADVSELIRRNPDLRVVVREFPILSPVSEAAARMGLAAAEQGKYASFHELMFAAGKPDPATIEAVARAAGLDLARARQVGASPQVGRELQANLAMARALGFDGTPSWVAGDEILSGAVGVDRLAEAVARARRAD